MIGAWRGFRRVSGIRNIVMVNFRKCGLFYYVLGFVLKSLYILFFLVLYYFYFRDDKLSRDVICLRLFIIYLLRR